MTSIKEILQSVNAVVICDHFVYTSELHGSAYVNKDAIYSDVLHMETIGKMIAEQCATPEVVLGPAVGGALLAQWVAKAYSREDMLYRHVVPAVYADKDGDDFIIKRGYDKLIAGKKVLLVEDILNTGITLKKVIAAARQKGADIIGVGAICNRGEETAESLEVPWLRSLLDVPMITYPPDKCPLCRDEVPINEQLGHGRQFMERRRGAHRIEGGMPPLS